MLKKFIYAAMISSPLLLTTGCSKTVESADLGRVLDVFADSMDSFKSATAEENTKSVSDGVMQEFTKYTQKNLNSAGISSETLGLQLKQDGSFEGYPDFNKNASRDGDEKTMFTVEIDTENSRLIATDETGSTGTRFSGAGFLAGAILGNLLGRQKKAGVSPAKKRNVKPRSSYSSARSKSFSGSHSSGK